MIKVYFLFFLYLVFLSASLPVNGGQSKKMQSRSCVDIPLSRSVQNEKGNLTRHSFDQENFLSLPSKEQQDLLFKGLSSEEDKIWNKAMHALNFFENLSEGMEERILETVLNRLRKRGIPSLLDRSFSKSYINLRSDNIDPISKIKNNSLRQKLKQKLFITLVEELILDHLNNKNKVDSNNQNLILKFRILGLLSVDSYFSEINISALMTDFIHTYSKETPQIQNQFSNTLFQFLVGSMFVLSLTRIDLNMSKISGKSLMEVSDISHLTLKEIFSLSSKSKFNNSNFQEIYDNFILEAVTHDLPLSEDSFSPLFLILILKFIYEFLGFLNEEFLTGLKSFPVLNSYLFALFEKTQVSQGLDPTFDKKVKVLLNRSKEYLKIALTYSTRPSLSESIQRIIDFIESVEEASTVGLSNQL